MARELLILATGIRMHSFDMSHLTMTPQQRSGSTLHPLVLNTMRQIQAQLRELESQRSQTLRAPVEALSL